jgi:hypothetical protein
MFVSQHPAAQVPHAAGTLPTRTRNGQRPHARPLTRRRRESYQAGQALRLTHARHVSPFGPVADCSQPPTRCEPGVNGQCLQEL